MDCRRLQSYWFRFYETPSDEIDAILEVIASAGKAYHHTEGWSGMYENNIQDRASAAARVITRLRTQVTELTEERDKLIKVVKETKYDTDVINYPELYELEENHCDCSSGSPEDGCCAPCLAQRIINDINNRCTAFLAEHKKGGE